MPHKRILKCFLIYRISLIFFCLSKFYPSGGFPCWLNRDILTVYSGHEMPENVMSIRCKGGWSALNLGILAWHGQISNLNHFGQVTDMVSLAFNPLTTNIFNSNTHKTPLSGQFTKHKQFLRDLTPKNRRHQDFSDLNVWITFQNTQWP